ncbi:LutC/YkgG family protein [Ureibacillus sp. FSL K6-0165]|jgi:L-lactate dehydrogenase complex protein LldG|uniref:LutC/YkgG family protein n=1 Tax=Ureibacillus sp. FSL K6-0165 TaxID=2954606 RepID=UPI0030F5A778
MTITNRKSFLMNIAKHLGRPMKTKVERPVWKHLPQFQILNHATQEELIDVLKQQCHNIHTVCLQTTTANLASTLQQVVEDYGGISVMIPKDDRLKYFGLTEVFKSWQSKGIEIYEWHPQNREQNIQLAEKANIAILISEMTLAESASVVLYSHPNRGRSLNLLPEKTIVLIPKSTIVPRITQAAQIFHKQVEQGEQIPSCILFMSGPSNSADIEMVLIVGVHGPIKATYIIIEDQ